jgi:DNA-directed RNA polymerase subunit RPC12/RpoP
MEIKYSKYFQMEDERKKLIIYRCMTCGKQYVEDYLPTVDNGDGCCSIGSLIEVKKI